MPRRESNAKQLTSRILAILEDGGLLQAPDRNPAAMEEAAGLIASLLVRKGFNREEVHTARVTILLSDIRGFSAMANAHPPDQIIAMLNRYFDKMGGIIQQYNGRIDKLMGDSILVVFGLPEPRPDDAERAVACAVEMQLAMTEVNEKNQHLGMPDLYMGIGINSGEVVVGELGSEHYNEYTVIGDQVNLASRIESHCLRGQILISEHTYEETSSFLDVSEPNPIEVKGGLEAINLYEVFATKRPRPLEVPRREVRKSPRVRVAMPLLFQTLANKIVQSEKYQGKVLDISYHGMQMQSEVRLPKLSEIKMTLAVELFGEKHTEVYGRILSCDKNDQTYRHSMEFTSISREGQAAIKHFVDQLVDQ